MRGWDCWNLSCDDLASARFDGKRSTSSMQLCRVKGHGLTSDILHVEPFPVASEFLLVIWISQTVNASIRSIPLIARFRLLSSSLFSSNQNMKVFPVFTSNERSSHLGPFSMLLDAFSNEYICMTGPVSPGPLLSSDSLLDPLFFWFCVYGAAPHPAASGLMMVKRVGIFLFPLYVSFSNDIAL